MADPGIDDILDELYVIYPFAADMKVLIQGIVSSGWASRAPKNHTSAVKGGVGSRECRRDDIRCTTLASNSLINYQVQYGKFTMRGRPTKRGDKPRHTAPHSNG